MLDPFALLGLPRSFDVDPRALQAAYLKRSAALHPDRFRDPLKQAEAQREAATLNDAHATLVDDEQRANTLLALVGGPTKEQDKTLPDGFLIEIMEIRQDMEAALTSGDADERLRLERWAGDRRHQHITTVREMFASLGQPGDAHRLSAIRQQLNAWRYIERMMEQLHQP